MIQKSEQEIESIKNIFKELHRLEEAYEVDADHLRIEFYARRIELQKQAQLELDREAGYAGKASKKIWCSLHLNVRTVDGSLQVCWQTINISPVTKKKIYGSIPKGSKDSYDLRKLSKYAKDFEWELVKETEAVAGNIRVKWKRMVSLRATLNVMERKSP